MDKLEKIVKLVKLVVFSRKGYDKKSNNSVVVKYLKMKNIIYIKNKHINISSTSLRKILKKHLMQIIEIKKNIEKILDNNKATSITSY